MLVDKFHLLEIVREGKGNTRVLEHGGGNFVLSPFEHTAKFFL